MQNTTFYFHPIFLNKNSNKDYSLYFRNKQAKLTATIKTIRDHYLNKLFSLNINISLLIIILPPDTRKTFNQPQRRIFNRIFAIFYILSVKGKIIFTSRQFVDIVNWVYFFIHNLFYISLFKYLSSISSVTYWLRTPSRMYTKKTFSQLYSDYP